MDEDLNTTPLDLMHRRLGAKMVSFAGYAMPLHYKLGIMAEHNHCRASAGLFDVSHMGQIKLVPRSGDIADAALALERLVPADLVALAEGRQRYTQFTNEHGGIMDDLMVANRTDHLFLVVNASNKAADYAHMEAHLSEVCEVQMLSDRALLALQGPGAASVLAPLAPDTLQMRFMDVIETEIAGAECIVARSGYTGEDGFEISVSADAAEDLARALLSQDAVAPIGLGARDSLRLEAGLCLHGNDIDRNTTPVEADLVWSIQKSRRTGGTREGDFPGADRILSEIAQGPVRRRVGLAPDGRAPVRTGASLHAEEGGPAIGAVTSGIFGPTIQAPVAMGYVATEFAAEGSGLFAEVRGRFLPVTVAKLPFVKQGYKR